MWQVVIKYMKYNSDVWTSVDGKLQIKKSEVLKADPPTVHTATGGFGGFDPFNATIYTSFSSVIKLKNNSTIILSGEDASNFWKWYDDDSRSGWFKWLR
jgi:hypothetical protein